MMVNSYKSYRGKKYLSMADFLRSLTLLKKLGNPFRRWSKLNWCFIFVKDLYQGIANLLSVTINLAFVILEFVSRIPGAFMLTRKVTQLVC